MTRVLVTGSRDWGDHLAVYRGLHDVIAATCPMGHDSRGEPVDWDTSGLVVVHGACPTGADDIADEYAVANWVRVERHPANWKAHGKAAGFIRNEEMVRAGADWCLAFIKDASLGATMTARLAVAARIPTRVFNAPFEPPDIRPPEPHQVWVAMGSHGRSWWEIRGTGAVL